MPTNAPTIGDLAEAEQELATAKTYRTRGGDLNDANAESPGLGSLRGQALEVVETKVGEGYEDPSLIRILYHAYDGRVVPVPSYMAARKLAERFPNESFVPAAYRKTRAWYLEPQKAGAARLDLMCMLHIKQDPEVQAEIKAAGIMPGVCEKSNIPSGYALEQHMRLKHKQEYAAIERLRVRKEAADVKDSDRAQTEAILELARSLANK